MKIVALILAGGCGERFWPRSRRDFPKQFLCLTHDGKTMIRRTVERILPLVEWGDIYVSTNADYRQLVLSQLPEIPAGNILCEPVGRNTAPCIGLAAAHIAKKHGDAVMIALPADHLIEQTEMFHAAIHGAIAAARQGEHLVAIGVAPSRPETDYGYIQFDPARTTGQACAVTQFTEKPGLETAERYLASGQYLWNSGMFIWKCSTLLEAVRRWLPPVADGLARIAAAIGTPLEQSVLEREYVDFPSVSVDCGVLENARNLYVVPGAFDWDDVGSWLAMERLGGADEHGNVVSGDAVAVGARNCVVQGGEKFLALVGVEDLIVVDSGNATLICAKNATPDVKQVLAYLRSQSKVDLL